MNGIIGLFEGIRIKRCSCGGDAMLYREGNAKEIFDFDADDYGEICFTEQCSYGVECAECIKEAYGYRTPEEAIKFWNEKV